MFKIATVFVFTLVIATAHTAHAGRITDCKVISPTKGGVPVELVLPVKGSGVVDFHFRMGSGYARSGADAKTIAVCKVGEKEEAGRVVTGSDGKPVPIFSTVYRAEVRRSVATVMVEMPDKEGAVALVSAVVDGKTYHGRLVAGATKVEFGDKTPETSWKPE